MLPTSKAQERMLAKGTHAGYEWVVLHNGMGFRLGYVKVPADHPWYGLDYNDIGADVHGGLTFAGQDTESGYWVGFDCAHAFDKIDTALPWEFGRKGLYDYYVNCEPCVLRTQEYVEEQCRSLCEQAAAAALPKQE